MFYSKEQCQIQVNFDKSIKRLYFLSDSFSFLFPFIMHHNFSKGNFIFSWISCHKIAFIVHFRLNTFLVSIILPPPLVNPPLFHFLFMLRSVDESLMSLWKVKKIKKQQQMIQGTNEWNEINKSNWTKSLKAFHCDLAIEFRKPKKRYTLSRFLTRSKEKNFNFWTRQILFLSNTQSFRFHLCIFFIMTFVFSFILSVPDMMGEWYVYWT